MEPFKKAVLQSRQVLTFKKFIVGNGAQGIHFRGSFCDKRSLGGAREQNGENWK